MTTPEPPPSEVPSKTTASAYAAGGGGTVLEQHYGALILGHLLTGDPVSELGNDATVVQIQFQAHTESAVDDLLIRGRGGDGVERLAVVAVRRKPKLVPSDDGSVKLVASYLVDLTDHWSDFQSGQRRLGLSSVPTNPVQELADLSEMARANTSDSTFRAAAANRDGKVRNRLEQLDGVVKEAMQHEAMQHVDTGGVAAGELTWRFLSSLWVRQVRLESPDESDLNSLAGRLRSVTRGATPDEASRLPDAIIGLEQRMVIQRIVDGLAAHGDNHAVALQRAEE